MRFLVDEMPYDPSWCDFAEHDYKSDQYICLLNPYREYKDSICEDTSKCPYLKEFGAYLKELGADDKKREAIPSE